jgi:hypothetical protein
MRDAVFVLSTIGLLMRWFAIDIRRTLLA